MAYVWDLVRDVATSALGAHPAPTPAVKGRLTMTGSQVRALYQVVSDLATRSANVRDVETVANIAIDAALMAAGPVAASLAAPAAEAIAAFLIERARPGASGEGWTRESRGGRRA